MSRHGGSRNWKARRDLSRREVASRQHLDNPGADRISQRRKDFHGMYVTLVLRNSQVTEEACRARCRLLVRGSAGYFTPTVSAVEEWQTVVEVPKHQMRSLFFYVRYSRSPPAGLRGLGSITVAKRLWFEKWRPSQLMMVLRSITSSRAPDLHCC